MNKIQFLEELSRHLKGISDDDRKITLDFYAELISDQIEEGMTEEQAVAALGSIDQIVHDVAPELQNTPHTEPAAPADDRMTAFHEPVHAIIADCGSANISMLHGTLPEGTTALVEYRLPALTSCSCTLQNGTLHIRYIPQRRPFSLKQFLRIETGASIQITLACETLRSAEINSDSGDIVISGLSFTGSLESASLSGNVIMNNNTVQGKCSASSRSGDLKLYKLSCGPLQANSSSGNIDLQDICTDGSCHVQTISGDMLLVSLQCSGMLQTRGTSGDIESRGISARDANITTASGDILLHHSEIRSVSIESSSGDVRLEQIASEAIHASSRSGDISIISAQSGSSVVLHTASGDIMLRDAESQRFELSSISGDITGTLTGKYDYRAHSGSGDVQMPESLGRNIVIVQSTSGDIRFHA